MEVHYSDYSLLSFYFLFTISLQGGLWSSREERRSEALQVDLNWECSGCSSMLSSFLCSVIAT